MVWYDIGDNHFRPERRTALVAKEMQCYRIDIAALSETWLADRDSLKEDCGRYTLFWKGNPKRKTGSME